MKSRIKIRNSCLVFLLGIGFLIGESPKANATGAEIPIIIGAVGAGVSVATTAIPLVLKGVEEGIKVTKPIIQKAKDWWEERKEKRELTKYRRLQDKYGPLDEYTDNSPYSRKRVRQSYAENGYAEDFNYTPSRRTRFSDPYYTTQNRFVDDEDPYYSQTRAPRRHYRNAYSPQNRNNDEEDMSFRPSYRHRPTQMHYQDLVETY